MAGRKLIHAELRHDTLIVELHKDVNQFADAELLNELSDLMQEMSESSVYHVIVDLGQLTYFGSLILESLRKLWTVVNSQQGKLVLCNVSDVSREVLHISRFDTIWPIYESCDAALTNIHEH